MNNAAKRETKGWTRDQFSGKRRPFYEVAQIYSLKAICYLILSHIEQVIKITNKDLHVM